MSQRNPLNEREQQDKKGQTRKSASSAKPKTKAASSVYVKPAGSKTKEEKKAEQKAIRAKERELNRLYYNPPTARYKKLRRLWWGFLGGSIFLTLAAMLSGSLVSAEVASWLMWVFLIPAYVCIGVALWLDFTKIRKERLQYQSEMAKRDAKLMREVKREEAKRQKAAPAAAAEPVEKKGFFSRFKKSDG